MIKILNPIPTLIRLAIIFWSLTVFSSCANMGVDFNAERVADLVVNKTSKQQVLEYFGKPWRVGVEDGKKTWTYGKYQYKLFGKSNTKDLVIRFNSQNNVASYTFNTSNLTTEDLTTEDLTTEDLTTEDLTTVDSL